MTEASARDQATTQHGREAREGVERLHDPNAYTGDLPNCDIVMKGGITSGIVYPLAVCELATQYRFRSVGGTSAGAIAAVATVAAELGRRNGSGRGFATLACLPQKLGAKPGPSAGAAPGDPPPLLELFQPHPRLRGLFSLVLAAMQPGWTRLPRIVLTLLRFYPFGLLGLGPGLLLWFSSANESGVWRVLGYVNAVLALAVGFIIVNAILVFRHGFRSLPGNDFGLCTGMGVPGARAPALTEWMTDYLDVLSGKFDASRSADDRPPLTFADLWGTADPLVPHELDLKVITTNLTLGKPFSIPFETRELYFHPADFRKLFPERVVRWMEAHARPSPTADEKFAALGLKALPLPGDLPVVVAARMSLSFPVLFSAVPLYSVDRTRRNPADQRPERTWFSDGGLTSNFPVHFFDAPLPRWPTFAINLRPFHLDFPKHPDEHENAWVALYANQGKREWWRRLTDPPNARPQSALVGLWDWLTGFGHSRFLARFLGAIWNATQNWGDNSLVGMPGFRDRIAHVSLDGKEGGLNLNMEPPTITALSVRGWWAARKLWTKFQTPSDDPYFLNWEHHRWVRYHNTLMALQRWLGRLFRGFDHPAGQDPPYPQLIEGREWPNSDRTWPFHEPQTRMLIWLARRWAKRAPAREEVKHQALTPQPELRVRPRD